MNSIVLTKHSFTFYFLVRRPFERLRLQRNNCLFEDFQMSRIQMPIVLVHKDSLEKGRMIVDVHTIQHNHVRIPAVLIRHWDKN